MVTEGLRGKTRWWRKTPLEIAHPSRPLLGQDCSLMLFAAGSAAKEQVRTVVAIRRCSLPPSKLACVQWFAA